MQIISGFKGKGKTKVLIEKVNNDVKVISGSVIFLDNNNKHMYELSNRVKMINCTNYGVNSLDMFTGFILGVISQDHDIEKIYIDNFTSVAYVNSVEIKAALDAVKMITDRFDIDIILCFATDSSDVPDEYKSDIIAAL